jgi:hypothetical protein
VVALSAFLFKLVAKMMSLALISSMVYTFEAAALVPKAVVISMSLAVRIETLASISVLV